MSSEPCGVGCPFMGCDRCPYSGLVPLDGKATSASNVAYDRGQNEAVPFGAGNASGDLAPSDVSGRNLSSMIPPNPASEHPHRRGDA